MPRPLKQGLDYFSLDVDFFQDFKIRKIIRACGISATPVIISLLSRIYGNHGYYMEWDAEMPFLIADDVGISEGAVTEIVKKAIQVDFFNANMYNAYKILTSHGIQKRFLASTAKRKQVSMHRDFLLISVSSSRNLVIDGRNPPETELLTPEMNKVKESKVKQSKGEERRPAPEVSEELSNAFIQLTGGTNLVQMQKLSELVGKYTEGWVLDAMRIAAERGIRKLSYAEGILKDWAANGREAPKPQKKSNVHIATAEEWKGVMGW